MKLLNIRKRGVFVKAICAYMFGNEEPKFADRTIQGYFNLCRRKMDFLKSERRAAAREVCRKRKLMPYLRQKIRHLRRRGYKQMHRRKN